MANETPNHKYCEVTDSLIYNDGCESFLSGCCLSGCLFVISTPLIIFTIIAFISNRTILKWIFLLLDLLFLVGAVVIVSLDFCKLQKKIDANLGRPSPRLSEAQRAKNFLGFDFGSDFRLRTTESNDYDEILLDFEDKEFEPLKKYCEQLTESTNQITTENEITITEFKKYIVTDEGSSYLGREPVTKNGFTKIESFYNPKLSKDGNLWITSQLTLEVDYEYRTLKMSWTRW